jgi:hypothetical protein
VAQNDSWQRAGQTRNMIAEDDSARESTPEHIGARNQVAVVGLAAVRDPGRTLTNLTVYSRGRNIGHISHVALDSGGVPRRVQIAFNDGASAAWIDVAAIDYDATHRLATTGLDLGEMKALEATRFH